VKWARKGIRCIMYQWSWVKLKRGHCNLTRPPVWAPSVTARSTGGNLMYHITCTRLQWRQSSSTWWQHYFSAFFSTVSKRYIGANDVITADRNQCDHWSWSAVMTSLGDRGVPHRHRYRHRWILPWQHRSSDIGCKSWIGRSLLFTELDWWNFALIFSYSSLLQCRWVSKGSQVTSVCGRGVAYHPHNWAVCSSMPAQCHVNGDEHRPWGHRAVREPCWLLEHLPIFKAIFWRC